jgi:DNA-directed RNA polymerase subunit RPC12/RpoP
MTEETRQHSCSACGKSFAVPASIPPEMASTKCPDCQRGGKISEAEAIALVAQMGKEMGRDKDDPIYFYAQRIGIFTIVLCGCGLVMLLAYTQLNKAPGFPLLSILGLVALGMGGGLLAYWANKNSRPDRF